MTRSYSTRKLAYAFFVSLLAMVFSEVSWAESAAVLQKLSGVVSVQRPDGRASLVYDGMAVNAGDTVTTELDSSVLIVFADKSQVALRPATKFQIKAFHYDEAQPQTDNLIVALFKGGLRTISGFVSKRGIRSAYRLETTTATIGIRGTDFSARLCEKDCEKEQTQRHPIQPPPSGTIGRVAELTGSLINVLPDGRHIGLAKSYPLFESDELRMGDTGYALLVFSDGTRLLLQAGASMKLKSYRFEQLKPESSNMAFEMLKGAVRIVSGLIGKVRPDKVLFSTATSTIGIRGTAFDLICGRKDQDPCDDEIFVSMRDGKTVVTSGERELLVSKGMTAHIARSGAVPEIATELPAFIQDNKNPLPEGFSINLNEQFGMTAKEVPAGLYTSVNEGRIVLTQGGMEVEIDKGETGFAPANGQTPLLLPITPAFINYDPTLGWFPFIPGLCGAN